MASQAACGIHPPRRLEAAVLCQLPAGPADQVLVGGFCSGPLSQLPDLPVGRALLPLPTSGAETWVEVWVWALVCGGVKETGGVGGPGGVLVVLCCGGAWGAGA